MANRSNVVVRIEYNRFPALALKLTSAAMDIVQETLEEIDQTVQEGMAKPGQGRIYVRGGRIHQASAPGDMPAIDTKTLADSMKHEIVRGQYKGYYYTEEEHAPPLEYGAPARNLLPRPFMTPAALKAKANFMRKMQALESHLK